jgi:hypothetical protein
MQFVDPCPEPGRNPAAGAVLAVTGTAAMAVAATAALRLLRRGRRCLTSTGLEYRGRVDEGKWLAEVGVHEAVLLGGTWRHVTEHLT